MTVSTVLTHLEKLVEARALLPERDFAHLSPDPDRFAEAKKAFDQVFTKVKEMKLSPTKELLDDSFSFEELRLIRLFLRTETGTARNP